MGEKYLYIHRNDTYCIIINNNIEDIFTLKAVLIKAFLVKGKSEILKYFLYGCPPRTPLKVFGVVCYVPCSLDNLKS